MKLCPAALGDRRPAVSSSGRASAGGSCFGPAPPTRGVYRIHPLSCGVLTGPKEAQSYGVDRGVEIAFPVLAFLLDSTVDGGPTVLVDTGVQATDSAYMREQGREVGPPGGGPGPLLDGLEERGVRPADVDVLVLTHLHHDHASHVDRFPGARVLVQREELAFARDPLPPYRRSYPEAHWRRLEDLDVTLLDGDHRVADGVELLSTPGHTPGGQSVVVETAGGPHALVGDLAYNRHNLEPGIDRLVDATGRTLAVTPAEGDYLPPGYHTDVPACYASVARVRERLGDEGTVVPSHDPRSAGEPFPRGS